MSLFNILDISGSALSAQSVRLNTTASNLANVDSIGGDPATAYRARHPVFASLFNDALGDKRRSVGVRVIDIRESTATPRREYRPDHPQADTDGYVYLPSVNAIEEMADMISASRTYQNNVEVMNTSKEMLLRTLSLGQ